MENALRFLKDENIQDERNIMKQDSSGYEFLQSQKDGKEIRIIGTLLFRLYGLSKSKSIRWLIRFVILRLEGGGHYSRTIRRIFAHYHQVYIGMYTNDPCYNLGQFPAGTQIGRYSGVYPTVRAFNGNHPMDRKSSHAFFFNPGLGYMEKGRDIRRTNLVIGNDAIIYHNAVILAGVERIGNGAIIGAGAIVTKNVPAYAIVVGNPARILKYRFPEEVQKKLEDSRWWEESIESLKERLDDFLIPLNDANFHASK